MPAIDNVLLGPFRILLLFLGVLFVHQIVTRQPIKNYNLDYILRRATICGSIILLLIFILVQFNMYDIFSLLTLFFCFLILQYIGIKNFNNIIEQFQKKRKSFLLGFFRFMEKTPSIRNLFKKSINLFYPQKLNYISLMAVLVSLACFISRYLFLKNDLYTLSGSWLKNLEIVKQFNYNIWLSNKRVLSGENAVINFYSKITGISEEMAVHSFGLLEVFGVSIILYWILIKITRSKFIAPMIGVLFFGFCYRYMPININLLLEHNPLYMAIWFALPAMLFTVVPKLLTKKKQKYFVLLCITYAALTLVNFFMALIIMPIFLILALIFQTQKTLPYIARSILSYLLGTSLIIFIHVIACWYKDISFISFIRENMILVNSYTYFPQLITKPENLILIYTYIGWAAIIAIFPLVNKNRKKWTPALVFLLFFNAVLLLKWMYWDWLDIDLYYQTISVFIVLLVGITAGIIRHYFKISIPKNQTVRGVVLSFLFLGLIVVPYFTNGVLKYDFEKMDDLKTDALIIYDDLSSNHLPFSYAVVNHDYGYNISKNEHHYINYNAFINTYIERDSLYQIIKDNKELLKEQPENILSNSVFVFISKNKAGAMLSSLHTPNDTRKKILESIKLLKTKGRKVNIFYENDFLTVLEIVNKEKASRLNDLIFDL